MKLSSSETCRCLFAVAVAVAVAVASLMFLANVALQAAATAAETEVLEVKLSAGADYLGRMYAAQRRVHKSCPECRSVHKTWDDVEATMQIRNALTHIS
eukprot:scaffold18916_cov81-Skeletonema_dohrnii-CCMP3373.AAC.3